MKTIGIIGSRRRNSPQDFEMLEKKFLEIYEAGDQIVSGGCPKGGDYFAEVIAKKHQIPIKIYYAQWDKLGKRAGFARNTDIAKDSDVLLSLVAKDRTGGAEDTIKKAYAMGKKIIALECNHSESEPQIPPQQVMGISNVKCEPEQTTLQRTIKKPAADVDIFSV